ncbi:MAG: sigma-70 family RNA polymerase sigma factor [Acidobacteria bacterium]|nr:sigma-70 family RNA polymerase sigma factor [Acidobacteriota bacterium]
MGRAATLGVLVEERADSNTALVEACLRGDQDAWAALVDKYKRLIFSIPIRQGFSREDAADVFQTVCVDLVRDLPRLREPEALPQWLIRTTLHTCGRHRLRQQRAAAANAAASELATAVEDVPDALVRQLERDQALRDAIRTLPPRCRLMVEMLFFETPPVPYAEVAVRLGLATGSVGFIRGRCLERLRAALRRAGL